MKKLLTKVLFSALAGLIVLFSFAPYFSPAKAQTWYNQSFQEWYGKVYDPTNPSEIFGERYTAAQVQWIIYGLFGFLINTITGPQNAGLVQCFISNTANVDGCKDQLSKLISSTNVQDQTVAIAPREKQSLLSLVFATDRPISGISYVKEKLQNFNLVPVAHAQTVGIGFTVLQPIQDLWRAFRNISYGLFVIVAIIFAFMIMFRVKLSPQTVISVQSALPKIIISLILVTFSYAIAGFLIDIMYVVIGLISLVGGQMNLPLLTTTSWFNIMTVGQPMGWNVQFGILVGGALYLISFAISLLILIVINVGEIITALAAGVIGVLLATGAGSILLLLGFLIFVIIIIITLWMFFKTVFSLLKAFVNILLLTILAPLQLTLGTIIPNLGFGPWIKNYVSNLAVFVVTGVLLLFSYVFLYQGVSIGLRTYSVGFIQRLGTVLLGSGGLLGPLVTGGVASWPPLLGGGGDAGVGLLFVITSFVIFTMIPKANELIQSFLSGKPFAYGTAIGEAFGGVGMAYNQTIGPGVEQMRRYGSQRTTYDLLTKIDKEMTSGKLQWMPGGIKDFVGAGSKSGEGPKPWHS